MASSPDAPLHCYALEQAEAAEVIDVDSIYLAGNRLYVFVGGEVGEEIPDYYVTTGNPTVGAAVYTGIAEEMKEFAGLWPGWVRANWTPSWYDACESGESDAECLVRWLPWGVVKILDGIESYDSLYLRAGTEEGRKMLRGWGGWTKLWPVTAQGGNGGGGGERAPSPTSFDISDVDTTNFPELDCSLANSGHENACDAWAGGVANGIGGVVGQRATGPVYGEGPLYFQLHKDPDDLEAFEAAKAEILRLKPADWQPEWVIIPVRYTFPELWKWAEILDRFAHSQGNTIGITGAGAMHNGSAVAHAYEVAIYPEAGPGPAWEGDGWDDVSLMRTTIIITALDAHVVQDALPILLSQLCIPIDAVGVILGERQAAEWAVPGAETPSEVVDGDADTGRQSAELRQLAPSDGQELTGPSNLSAVPECEKGSGFPIWALVVIVVGAVVLVLVSAGAGRAILRRRAS